LNMTHDFHKHTLGCLPDGSALGLGRIPAEELDGVHGVAVAARQRNAGRLGARTTGEGSGEELSVRGKPAD